ncbi:MAG: solute carrier family 26 protein [Bacteroidota bacterium]
MKILSRIFPIVESTKGYTANIFKDDLIAGLTVGIMLVPQGMAYALLAGMPPIYGLYGGLVPLFLYALFGTSRQMSVGPVAVSALLVLGGVSQLATPETPEYINLVLTAGLLIGIAQMVLSFLRLGFLVNFLSHPVVAGFTSAAAIIIAISQLKDLLGFAIPKFSESYETLFYAVEHLAATNWISVVLCLSSITIMLALKSISRNIPGALIVVVMGTVLSWFFNLESYGLNLVRNVPEGLPAFQVPDLRLETIQQLIPTVLTVTLIGIVESLGIAKVLEAKHQDYEVRPNQELLALGIAKFGGAFFQAIPSSGSFTRSAINNEAGSKTTVSSIITAILIVLTLLFLTPLFYYLPKAVLAAIILMAVRSLFDYQEAIHLWHTHKEDFVMMMVTFVATLAINIPVGIATGVLLSAGANLYRSSKPHIAILGQLPNAVHFRNIRRFSRAKELEGKIIMRFDDQLYFANASYFKDAVKDLVQNCQRPISYFYLDATNIHGLDSSGLTALKEVYRTLRAQGIQLCICGATGPVRDMLDRSGFMKELGKENHFVYLYSAHQYHQKKAGNLGEELESNEDALQSNYIKKRLDK